jgi:hypothetical protein
MDRCEVLQSNGRSPVGNGGVLLGMEGVIWNESNHLGMDLGMEVLHLGKEGVQLWKEKFTLEWK